MRSLRRRAAWILAAGAALAGCSMPYIPGVTQAPPAGAVTLKDATGRVVGNAVFLEQDDGNTVKVPPSITLSQSAGIPVVRINQILLSGSGVVEGSSPVQVT